MPLAFVFDENLRGPIWNAVERHNMDGEYPLDVVRVGDFADLPLGSDDPEILRWAEREDRILVTEDRQTMPVFLTEHLAAGHESPGVILLRPKRPRREIVEALKLAAIAGMPDEYRNAVRYIP